MLPTSRCATRVARRFMCAQHRGHGKSVRLNEFRHNLATDEWVVFSAARQNRPRQVTQKWQADERLSEMPEHVSSCPFCPGNEHLTPPPLLTNMDEAGRDWRLRIVPNKYPVVTLSRESLGSVNDNPRESDSYLMEEHVNAFGFHEVVVETSKHNLPLSLADPQTVEHLVHAFKRRGLAMMEMDSSLRHVMYFKNSGGRAGASMQHPHSQIVGLPIVPAEVAHRQRHAREWYLRFQKNVFQYTLDETARQRDQGGMHRVVVEDDHFMCFVPYAALSPFSLWIVPKGSTSAHFHRASTEQLSSFARMLRYALQCLHVGLDEPDFNLVIRSAALETGAMSVYRPERYFRWYCLIVPRLDMGAMGGFEYSTGIQSNSSFPEDDAAFLREVGQQLPITP
ncbi:hypothetical protein AB1Y20_000416 [Prymnesium parvum]|uniref:Galactose-1-phosphate uridyl transferase N-terminal domain-containing protein n=1 Tax=Prymnesium parvum TaxID=97485 RepID=A0AB34K4U2_PRYPA